MVEVGREGGREGSMVEVSGGKLGKGGGGYSEVHVISACIFCESVCCSPEFLEFENYLYGLKS